MADHRGKASSRNQPSKGTSKDQRLAGRGAKPGPAKGSAAAAKGSAAGGRKSRKK